MLYHVRHVQVEESKVEMAEETADTNELRKTDTAEVSLHVPMTFYSGLLAIVHVCIYTCVYIYNTL